MVLYVSNHVGSTHIAHTKHARHMVSFFSSLLTSPSPSSAPAKVDLIRKTQNPRHNLGPRRAHTYDGDEGACNRFKTFLEVELGELGKLISE